MMWFKYHRPKTKHRIIRLICLFMLFLNVSLNYIIANASTLQNDHPDLNIVWEKRLDGPGSETIHDLIPISNHQFVAIGSSDSEGNAWESIWILKGNQSGEIIAEQFIGDDYYNSGHVIISAPENHYIVGGEINWLYCPSCHELGKAWIAMIDEEFNIQWEKSFNLEGNSSISAMVSTKEEGFSLAGFDQIDRYGSSDAWFAYSDWEGNIIWSKNYDRLYQDKVTDIIDLGKNGFLFSGHSQSKNLNNSIAWILKTDRKGEIEWEKNFIGQGINLLNKITKSEQNSFISVGYTTSKGAGWQDGWIVCLDENGEIRWEKTFGGENRDIFTSVTEKDNYLLVTGYTHVSGKANDDGWIVCLDENGEIRWEKTFGGENRDELIRGITKQNLSTYYVFGSSNVSQKDSTNEDGWIIKLNIP